MDTLRISILRILDRLSETHRQNLHFVFANYVPRIISDDLSPKGTLKLIETLFERGFVSEQNPTMLVNAFHSIQFHEGMKILEGNVLIVTRNDIIYQRRFFFRLSPLHVHLP